MPHIEVVKVTQFFSGEPGRQNLRDAVVTYQAEGRPPNTVTIPWEKITKKVPGGAEDFDFPALEKEIVLRDTASRKVEGYRFQA